MHINVETFDALMRKGGMTLAELSRKSKVGTKTIGRIRKSEDLRKSNVDKIAAVLGVDISTLINPPSDALIAGAAKKPANMERMVIDLKPSALNRIWMTAHHYNISVRALLEFAPLLFSIAAETSLNQRRKTIENLSDSLEEMLKEAPVQFSNEIEDVKSSMNDLYWAEMDSIEKRDLTGGVKANYCAVPYQGADDSVDEHNFFNTIEEMAETANLNLLFYPSTMEDVWYEFDNDEPYDAIFPHDFRNNWHDHISADQALRHGDILVRDIPIDLMAKNKAEERVQWLYNAYEMAKERIEERQNALRAEREEKEASDA